jgi:hydrogenase maturation protease
LLNIMVLGIGNEILTDEGVGIHLIRALRQVQLPENVELLEGGTAGLELLPLIAEVDRLIVVDAIIADDIPGAIFRFAPDDVNVIPLTYHVSAHQIGLVELLHLARMTNKLPDTVIFGVQPKDIGWGTELTPEMLQKIPRLVELVIDEINNFS